MDIRQQILDNIDNIPPLDEREQTDLAFAREWVNSGAELFRRQKPATPNPHLVSYFPVIDGNHILLVDHKDAGIWLPNGGHVEVGEHPKVTAKREAQEELGLDAMFAYLSPIFLTKTETIGQSAGHTDISLWYILTHDRNIPLNYDRSEFHGLSWFHFDEMPENSEPNLSRFIAKLRSM